MSGPVDVLVVMDAAARFLPKPSAMPDARDAVAELMKAATAARDAMGALNVGEHPHSYSAYLALKEALDRVGGAPPPEPWSPECFAALAKGGAR